MKKLRLFIFINIIIFLILVLSVVSRADQIKRETAKTKIEQAINKAPITQNKIDVADVKKTIKNDVSNSKIINDETNKFPVYTEVDGYDFKVNEDGKVEDASNKEIEEETKDKPEENKSVENNQKENNVNNIIIDENNNKNKKETLVKYNNETREGKGITISTTEDGMVTIDGKSEEKLFIKISNGIYITDKIEKDFEDWINKDRNHNRKRKKYKTKSKYVRKHCNKRTSKCSFKN